MLIPVGPAGDQALWLISKDKDGKLTETKLLGVSYVPLVKPSAEAVAAHAKATEAAGRTESKGAGVGAGSSAASAASAGAAGGSGASSSGSSEGASVTSEGKKR